MLLGCQVILYKMEYKVLPRYTENRFFLPVTLTVKVVVLDPARLLAVTAYVPLSDTPATSDLISVELALGGVKLLFTMETRSIPFTRAEVL